jgi:hypothetical protein
MKKTEDTKKFEIYFYRGKETRRGSERKPKQFVYKQQGTIRGFDENGKKFNKQFHNYGELLNIINGIMRKVTMKDFKERGVWK